MMSSNGFVTMADRVFPMTADEAVLTVYGGSPSRMTASDASVSEPIIPPDSPISCVSSRLQDEFNELLRYAVVIPTYNQMTVRSTVTDHLKSTAVSVPTSAPLRLSSVPATSSQLATFSSTVSSSGHTTGAKVATSSTVPKPTESKGRIEQSEAEDSFEGEEMKQICLPLSSANKFPNPQPHWLNLDDFRGDGHRPTVTIGNGFSEDMNPDDEKGSSYSNMATVDQDVSRFDALMDDWLAELKRKVMAEFSQMKIRALEQHRQQMMKQKDIFAGDLRRQVDETESVKELLSTYEQSIERKDQVISNLTSSLQGHRDKMDKQSSLCEWKIKLNDRRREGFASNLAYQHYQKTLKRRVWDAWHSLIESRWRQRVEKACQSKAQEVCITLTNDYETKLASLNEALEAARAEVQHLHQERNLYEETMKKAFMRGICALNLEAMTMFQEGDKGELPAHPNDNQRNGDDYPIGSSTTVPQEFVYSSDPTPGQPPPRVITSQSAKVSMSQSTLLSHSGGVYPKQPAAIDVRKSRGMNSKMISTKVTARPFEVKRVASTGSIGLGASVTPPMCSVIVERHHPITKQTIGHAMASKFQRPDTVSFSSHQPSAIQRQGTTFPIPTPNIQTIKVVE